MIIVGHNGRVIWGWGLAPRDFDDFQWALDNIMREGDFHIFVNFKVFCPNPEISRRIHVYPGASEFEIDRQRNLYDETRSRDRSGRS